MSKVSQVDLGTPAVPGKDTVNVVVDGLPVNVPVGTSVMRAAATIGVDIPRLCATDSLEPFGSCRLCLVEVDGRPGTPASCTTPVADGMVVHTRSERLDRIRKGVMELYLSDHPVDSLEPATHKDVELVTLARSVGLSAV